MAVGLCGVRKFFLKEIFSRLWTKGKEKLHEKWKVHAKESYIKCSEFIANRHGILTFPGHKLWMFSVWKRKEKKENCCGKPWATNRFTELWPDSVNFFRKLSANNWRKVFTFSIDCKKKNKKREKFILIKRLCTYAT